MGEALIEILPNSLGSFVVDDTLTQRGLQYGANQYKPGVREFYEG
jgi:hypothetical protein